ncbi:hypothetical protein MRX96_008268 [Rhipicephalus microplus]
MWFSACRCSAPLKFCRRALTTSIQRGCQSVKQILAFKDVNKAIEMKGWVRALRKHKDLVFVDLSDGSAASKVQVVVPANCVRPGLSYGSAIQVFGKLVASSHKGQELEVHAEDVTVLGPCDIEGYPFHPRKTYPPEYVRSFPHFRPRQAKEAAMLRLRSAALMAVHTAFQSQGFFHVHTPILTSNDCEGGGNVFTVKPMKQEDKEESERSSEALFFGTPVFLTVSAQLHLEAVALSLSRVYTAFVTSLDTLLQRTEDVMKNVFTSLVNSSNEDVAVITKDAPSGHLETVQAALEKPFTRMTYSECINVLQSARNEKSSLRNIEHCGNAAPLFVTHFPSALKPFYMKHSTLQPNTVEGFDLLAPFGGELCGGSLREDDHTVLEERLRNLGIADAFPWYLDLRKYGSAPHGGFGLGFDRMLQYFFAIQNIRDVVTFPRWSNHCSM